MNVIPELPAPRGPVAVPEFVRTDAQLFDAAKKLEATFLSEMLKSAGFGESRDTFGGGIGEDQFSSFLRDAHAKELVETGGIGLAEALFEAMKVRLDG